LPDGIRYTVPDVARLERIAQLRSHVEEAFA